MAAAAAATQPHAYCTAAHDRKSVHKASKLLGGSLRGEAAAKSNDPAHNSQLPLPKKMSADDAHKKAMENLAKAHLESHATVQSLFKEHACSGRGVRENIFGIQGRFLIIKL